MSDYTTHDALIYDRILRAGNAFSVASDDHCFTLGKIGPRSCTLSLRIKTTRSLRLRYPVLKLSKLSYFFFSWIPSGKGFETMPSSRIIGLTLKWYHDGRLDEHHAAIPIYGIPYGTFGFRKIVLFINNPQFDCSRETVRSWSRLHIHFDCNHYLSEQETTPSC